MSVRIMTLAWATDLPAGDRLVLLALADCANDEGHCWPGLASLSNKTGMCKRSLQEAMRMLDKGRHITRTENPGKGMNYIVHPVAKPAPVAKTAPVAKPAEGGGNNCHRGVAKSAPKPSENHQEPSPIKGAHAIPDDWKPVEFAEASQSRKVIDGWPPGEFAVQVEKFKAQHGKKGDKFVDWQKAWSTWVLNTRIFGIGRNEQRSSDPTGDALRAVHDALRGGSAFN